MKQREYTVPKNLKYDGKLYYNNFIETQGLMIFANYWSTDNQKKLVMKYDTFKNDVRVYDDNSDVTSSVDKLSREEYIKERLLDIESEKFNLENELKELRKSKISTICIGKNYSIVYLTNEKQIIIGTCTCVNASFVRIKTAISGISYEISVDNILEIEAKEDIDNIFKNLLSIVENEEIEFFNGFGD